MEPKQPQFQSDNPGMLAGLLGIARNLLGLVLSRIELASLELSGISGNLMRVLLLFALGITALWFAVAFWSVLLIFLAWEAWGWKILLLFAVLFTILTAGLGLYVRAILQRGVFSLPATMAELRKDRDALL